MTLWRVICAFVPAMVIGVGDRLLMGRVAAVDRWLTMARRVSQSAALVLIVLCYIWIGLNETAHHRGGLNKIPMSQRFCARRAGA